MTKKIPPFNVYLLSNPPEILIISSALLKNAHAKKISKSQWFLAIFGQKSFEKVPLVHTFQITQEPPRRFQKVSLVSLVSFFIILPQGPVTNPFQGLALGGWRGVEGGRKHSFFLQFPKFQFQNFTSVIDPKIRHRR